MNKTRLFLILIIISVVGCSSSELMVSSSVNNITIDGNTKEEKAIADQGKIPAGFYAVDTTGDGKLDTFKPGLTDYNSDGEGANSQMYDKTSEMFDYVRRNLIDPVDQNLRKLQKEKYDLKSKKRKRKLPGT